MSKNVLIGLGSNLDSPVDQIQKAINTLSLHKDIEFIKASSFYESQPQGPQDQDRFINAVILIQTELEPEALLLLLQEIERQQGKVKVRHWGERCIDLDILLFGAETLRSERLNIPHHEMKNRSFVIEPLLEIAPDLVLPDGTNLSEVTPTFGGNLTRQQRPVIDL